MLAEVLQLVLQKVDEDRHITIGVVGQRLAVALFIRDRDAVDLQLGVGQGQADMMLAPRVVDPLDVGRRVESDRVVVRVASNVVIDAARAVGALDGQADVALTARERLRAAFHKTKQRF